MAIYFNSREVIVAAPPRMCTLARRPRGSGLLADLRDRPDMARTVKSANACCWQRFELLRELKEWVWLDNRFHSFGWGENANVDQPLVA
jgi:hypothetical protein